MNPDLQLHREQDLHTSESQEPDANLRVPADVQEEAQQAARDAKQAAARAAALTASSAGPSAAELKVVPQEFILRSSACSCHALICRNPHPAPPCELNKISFF